MSFQSVLFALLFLVATVTTGHADEIDYFVEKVGEWPSSGVLDKKDKGFNFKAEFAIRDDPKYCKARYAILRFQTRAIPDGNWDTLYEEPVTLANNVDRLGCIRSIRRIYTFRPTKAGKYRVRWVNVMGQPDLHKDPKRKNNYAPKRRGHLFLAEIPRGNEKKVEENERSMPHHPKAYKKYKAKKRRTSLLERGFAAQVGRR